MTNDWFERVEREVAHQTARRDALYAKTQRRLERAQEKLRQHEQQQRPTATRKVERLRAEVERRRQELLALERLMTSKPDSPVRSGHRGVSRGHTL